MAASAALTHKDLAVGHGPERVARAWNEEEDEEEEEEEEEHDDEAWHDAAEAEDTTSTSHAGLPCRRRPLGGFEHFMYKAHQMGCGLIYVVAELECGGKGPAAVLPLPNSRLVEQALRPIVARHPNLRARITADSGQLEIWPVEEVAPAVCVVPFIITTKGREGGGGVVEFVKEEIKRTPVALGQCEGPFWQLFVVQEKEEERGREGGVKQSLVVLAHHSVMDGESVVLFLKEVVAGVEGLLRQANDSTTTTTTSSSSSSSSSNDVGKEQPPALALDFLPSQDELFETVLPPMPGDGPRGALAFLWRRVTWLLKRPTVPSPEISTTSLSLRDTHILSSRIQGPSLLQLLHRCHTEHTTVTAALAAATMLELKRLMPESPSANLKMETMVNLRKALCVVDEGRYACALQCLAAPIDTVVTVSDDDELWTHARGYKEGLTDAMKAGQWKRQVAAFHAFKYGIYEALARVAVSPRMQGRVKAAAISNLGVLVHRKIKEEEEGEEEEEVEEEGESLRIARLQWGITLHGMGQYVFVAASTQGECLNLTITCMSPMVSAERAHGLLDGIVGRLTL